MICVALPHTGEVGANYLRSKWNMTTAACLALAGAILGLWLPPVPCEGLVVGGLLFTSLLAWCLGGWPALGLPLGCASCALVLSAWQHDRLPAALDVRDVLVEGRVADFPRELAGVSRFRFAVSQDQKQPGVPASLYLSWFDADRVPRAGERWQLLVRLRKPHGGVNPGAFDFERWLLSAGIGATGYVRPALSNRRMERAGRRPDLLTLRSEIAGRLSEALAGRRSLPMIVGLTVGTRHLLGPDQRELLRRTGTAHLMAISGLHIALAGFGFLLVGRLLGGALRLGGLPVRPQSWGRVAALCGAPIYAGLAGFSLPTQRACGMLMLAAAVGAARRQLSSRWLVSVILLIVVLTDPLAVLSAGAWLSFAAVALIFALGVREQQHGGPVGRGRTYANALLRGQMIFSLGLAPVLLFFFGELPLIGFVANLLVLPLFSMLVIPAVLTGSLLLMISTGAGLAVLRPAASVIELLVWLLEALAAPMLTLWSRTAWSPALTLAGLGALILMLAPRPIAARWLGSVGLLPVLLGGSAPSSAPLRLTVMDVGHGLAVLAQTRHHALLYDTGPAYRTGNAGDGVVLPVLQHHGIAELDAIVLSHWDADHSGGLPAVHQRHPDAPLVASTMDAKWAGEFVPCRVPLEWEWDGVYFRVLHPVDARGWSDNDASCVLQIETGRSRILLPGDIEHSAEFALGYRDALSPVDLLVVPHHGSNSSSAEGFVTATRPRYVVYSVSRRNRWGFPHPVVRRRWRSAGSCALSSAETGALEFEVSNEGWLALVAQSRFARNRPSLLRSEQGAACLRAPDSL